MKIIYARALAWHNKSEKPKTCKKDISNKLIPVA